MSYFVYYWTQELYAVELQLKQSREQDVSSRQLPNPSHSGQLLGDSTLHIMHKYVSTESWSSTAKENYNDSRSM